MCAVLSQPKTVRLRALCSAQKFGVAGRSCQELLRKGCQRFQLPVQGSRLCLYEDGTEVTEDYFPGIPDDAELVLLTEGQTWQGYVSDIRRFLSVFHEPHARVIEAARQLLSDERAPLRQKLLVDLLHTVSQNIAAETRAQDPPWFEGLESRFRNKSGYLRYSCESRIRGYLREVSSCARVLGAEAQEEYLRILDSMCQKLKSQQYNGSYFDRGAEAGSRLCTQEGWFSCQGPFDLDGCASKHSINPYSNRESRVLFSTWNLDHMTQLSVCSGRKSFSPCLLPGLSSSLPVCWALSDTKFPHVALSRLPALELLVIYLGWQRHSGDTAQNRCRWWWQKAWLEPVTVPKDPLQFQCQCLSLRDNLRAYGYVCCVLIKSVDVRPVIKKMEEC
ncbi:DNA fragmentation factor subunit beta isoform X2 [Sciurus carolinensis]|uniref:DNA fragmentation factor subunit beta isoform X2 n=1 Tax=Sciurus carolinensis TaxID=30640 RepID=UPI001FB30792|nr:DNA fragmentation factor subunit beta isoform X2 [Sciurus carolinensis]